jgi:ADP-ribose pyrophosphatase
MNDYFRLLQEHPFLLGNNDGPLKIITDQNTIQKWQAKQQSNLTEQSQSAQWTDIGIIVDDPYIVALRDLVEFAGQSRNGYVRIYNRAYLEGGAAGVAMLPVKNDKILLLHNFRHATRSWHWEIPRGFGERGAKAKIQAKAEIKEEIGSDETQLLELGLYHNNTGLEGNPIHLFLARVKSVGEPKLVEGIDQFRWVSVEELEEMIVKDKITDGFTIAAYTRAKLKGLI